MSSSPSSLSHHEAAADIGLEDFIEGALGEGAAVEGEDLRHVAQTVFVLSAARHCHRGQGVVGTGIILCCTRRAEYTVQLHGSVEACRIAGVSDGLRVILRLKERHRQWD